MSQVAKPVNVFVRKPAGYEVCKFIRAETIDVIVEDTMGEMRVFWRNIHPRDQERIRRWLASQEQAGRAD